MYEDVFYQLVVKLFEIIQNINIDIDIQSRIDTIENSNISNEKTTYQITYN